MLGAIIGDIVGSIYESRRHRIKTKDFPFFGEYCRFTDDSVCTAAVADILLQDLPPAKTMQRWCRRYHGRGYGRMFREWRDSDDPEPYNSYGNGAAMRVSPAAFLYRDNLDAALAAADRVTAITHNHPEGMKGARATAHAIWLAFQGESAGVIREVISTTYAYGLTQTVDEIRPNYPPEYPTEYTPGFPGPVTCMGSVPQAITCALESVSFEDAVRNAISLGGDSDTLAAIAGSIAEALHGIPDKFIKQAKNQYLTDAPEIRGVIQEMYRTFNTAEGNISFQYGNNPIKCPNCDPKWKLIRVSKKFGHRYCYEHVDNDYVNSQNYIIVEPDRTGWMRVLPIGDTHLSVVRMGYDLDILEPSWEYYPLNCGCETVIPSNLEEILQTWQRNNQ